MDQIQITAFCEHLRTLETIILPQGALLYRGSHEGRRNEYENKPYINGVKYFDKNKENALRYLKKDNPNSCLPRPGARGRLFTIEIKETTKVIIFPDAGEIYFTYYKEIYAEWPDLRKSYNNQWFRDFEQKHIFPLIRKVKDDQKLFGITTDQLGDSREFILDMDRVKFEVVGDAYVEI